MNLESIFGKSRVSSCPVASKSLVYFQQQPESEIFQIKTDSPILQQSKQLVVYEIGKSFQFELVKQKEKSAVKYYSPVTAQRYLTGWGQEFGGIAVQITNNENHPVEIFYFELLPWYLKVYFHTLSVSLNNEPIDPYHSIFHCLFGTCLN